MMTLPAYLSSIIFRPSRAALAALAIVAALLPAKADDERPASNRYERNYIVDGNKLYKESRFAEAETMYKKALEQNPSSAEARFNLAAAYIRQSGSADPNADRNPMGDAQKLLADLAQVRTDMTDAERNIARLANYNLGNMAFNNNDFNAAIENYKRALRIDPDDDRARQNLRLAQLKLKEQQQNQDKTQDKNQDQDQNQDKDQNKDQQNQDQKQDQDKNQDQNQDNKDQNQDQPQGQDDKKKDKPQNQRNGISDANAEQILKAMENEEAATRKRVEAERRKAEAAKRRHVTNPW